MGKITTIIFDIGGVIARAKKGPLLRVKWAPRCGLDPHQFDQIVFNSPLFEKAAIGEITKEALWADRNRTLKLSETDLNQLMEEEGASRWDQDLINYINTLSSQYKLGIISDATSGARERVGQHIDLSLFKSIVFSYEAGVRKPDPKIYRQSLRELNVSAEKCLFIDDRQHNVKGAEAVGMMGYLYEELRPFQEFMSTLSQ